MCSFVPKASALILAGLSAAVIGFAGKQLVRCMPAMATKFNKALENLPKFDAETRAKSRYYKGGFEQQMTKREAGLILGISPNVHKWMIKAAHKRIMLINHPDRGGSPYLAIKINQAKDFLDKGK